MNVKQTKFNWRIVYILIPILLFLAAVMIFLFIIFNFILSLRMTDDDLYSLYKQRIENSNLVLYQFEYSGKFVTSSDYIGMTILDSTKKFSIDNIVEFPTEYFMTKPTGRRLELIKINYCNSSTLTEKDTILTPIKNYKTTINGAELLITEYNLTYGSASLNTGLMEYEFDRCEESKDSLTLFNVTKRFGGKSFSNNPSFEKGNIRIVENDNKKLLYIQIEQPIIERGSIYKPTSPFDLVPNQPIVDVATYKFYPRDSLTTEKLSDIGLWRQDKITRSTRHDL